MTKELKAIRREPAAELQAFELQALERLIEMTMLAVEAGEIERIEQLRKLLADRRKLLGLDAPSKVQVSQAPEEMWRTVREWLKSPTPELESALRDAGWTRS